MSRSDYIYILQSCSNKLKTEYGIKSLRLFGSIARGEDHEGSDVDVFVDTETPNPFLLMDAKDYLEQQVGRSVDIVRNHTNLNPHLRHRIERDGVTIF
jgi:predicted nucleotidyltransferase